MTDLEERASPKEHLLSRIEELLDDGEPQQAQELLNEALST